MTSDIANQALRNLTNDVDFNLSGLRHYRLGRIREQLELNDVAAIVLFDSVNMRYATDTTNMQVWGHHNPVRYVLVPVQGPVIVFDATTMMHLYDDAEMINKVNVCIPWTYFTAGPRFEEFADAWAQQITDLVKEHCGSKNRIASDRINPFGVRAIEKRNFTLIEGQGLMEHARVIKSDDEIGAIRCAIAAAEDGIEKMRQALEPGKSEREVWSILHQRNIELGGEWMEGHLFTSGPRTNPWFQECSDRVIQNGDLVAFDTDLVGPYGYCADISRTWVCGDRQAMKEQNDLYAVAVEHLNRNLVMVKAGLSFKEFAEKSENLPEKFREQQYVCAAHGIGMCDEYPQILYWRDYQKAGFDGVLEEGMTICVESYVGEAGAKEGVKMEQQILITRDGYIPLSTYPYEELLNSR
jgi:Xaa-Pro aminopeptidase